MLALASRLDTLAAASAPVLPEPAHPPLWQLSDLAGRLVELSGQQAAARLTAAFGLVLEAQICGDRAAWVTCGQGTFFPPDVAAGGVDVESLPVVRIDHTRAAGRAAEHLVRSGGFGLVVGHGTRASRAITARAAGAAADATPGPCAHASRSRADADEEVA